jgi:hypothetical protein
MNMKTKVMVIGTAVLVLAVIGTWAGRSVWAKRHGLVTLSVRNAPLKEVIQKLERQTGEKIPVDRKLDGLVTMDISRKPLASALDRIAEQCGASWRTVHAVYESKSALPELESVLYGDRKLDEVGWKEIAPAGLNGVSIDLPGGKSLVLTNGLHGAGMASGSESGGPVRIMVGRRGDGGAPVVTESGQGGLPPGTTIQTEDAVAVGGTNGTDDMKMKRQGTAVIVRMVRKQGDGPGNTSVEEEIWTPVEVVLEARLSDRLTNFSGVPTFEAAEQAAKSVKGNIKTYYSMRKSAIGGMGMGMPGMSFNVGARGQGGVMKRSDVKGQGGTTAANLIRKAGGMPGTADLEAAVAQHRNDELGKLTPEQRVLRARERQQQKK